MMVVPRRIAAGHSLEDRPAGMGTAGLACRESLLSEEAYETCVPLPQQVRARARLPARGYFGTRRCLPPPPSCEDVLTGPKPGALLDVLAAGL
ncbi:hypothetical protein ABH935_005896 [Catenulispora sp. GAS73]